jgi:nucleotide-binding universal stress UspA family protein
MLRKILVPVDLTTESPPEAPFALELARAFSAEIVLLHVVDYVPTLLPVELPGGYPLPQLEIVREAASEKLARIAAGLTGVTVRCVVEVGGAAAQIVSFVQRERVDLVVMGSHRHRALTRVILGSVADRVVHTAPCPVTIVRENRAP